MADPSPSVLAPLVARPGPDNVGLVLQDVAAGTPVTLDGGTVPARADVPAGHKIALRAIAAGEPVRKYAETIGFASAQIAAGDHVHQHNMGVRPGPVPAAERRAPGGSWRPPAAPTRDHFLGYRRPDGRAATRNYLAVLPADGSAVTAARLIAQEAGAGLTGGCLDGVVALAPDTGDGPEDGGPGAEIPRRTLAGYATHANVAGVLLVGSESAAETAGRDLLDGGTAVVERLDPRAAGGTAAAVTEGLRRIAGLAAGLAGLAREPIPVAELALGLQCGGSDAYSGLTANPTLGVAADLLVAAGGRVVLGETPEIHGAEHLLKERAATPEVAARIDELLRWWQEYTHGHGAALDDNPSAGNRAGGITTIWEKSLGAVLKAGTSPLNAVVGYAEPVTAPGLTFMDTPGYDPVSATGMVAGGANLLAFTTGRGSLFGCRPVPCVKISTTTRLFRHMTADVDFDAGPAMSHRDQVRYGTRLFELLVDTASGLPSKSEQLGFGAEEIAPWRMGAVL
jgi:altronate hydrolase